MTRDDHESLPSPEESRMLVELAKLYAPGHDPVLADFHRLNPWGPLQWTCLDAAINHLERLHKTGVAIGSPLAEVGAVLAVLHSLRKRAKLASQVRAQEVAACK